MIKNQPTRVFHGFLTLLFCSLLLCHPVLADSAQGQASVKNQTAFKNQTTTKSHAITMYGDYKYPTGFEHFDYSSTKAVKGGSLKLFGTGTFDSLNDFIAKGNVADKISLIYDTLTINSADEAFTQYGLIAEKLEYPDDHSWIIFHLDPRARFHDGVAITAEDVVFTFNLLVKEGNPFYKFYYSGVESVAALSKRQVKFTFKSGASKELPLTVGQLAILPKHYWQDRDFSQSSLEIPLGNGPYRIDKVDPGHMIRYKRVEDYWAADHPTRRGMYNFDRIQIDYYRDEVVALEALKAGKFDVRIERISKFWATAYTGRAIDSGELITEEVRHENPAGMQAFIFNTRRSLFQNRTLRQAIGLAFDFEWTNKNLFYGAYKRSPSFFTNSELASSGLPSAAELELLKQVQEHIQKEVFTSPFMLPVSDGKGRNRANLIAAKNMLEREGYHIVNNQLIDPASGKAVTFEVLMYDLSFKRIVNPFIQGLKKLGIEVKLRIVDTSQYINRIKSFDFDMVTSVLRQSLSPGNEQFEFWHSSSANTPGSRNLIGIQNPAVDHLVDSISRATTRAELITATQALDRVLLNEHYVIPQWYNRSHRLAYWDKFERPEIAPKYDPIYSIGLMTWWHKSSSLPEADATDKQN